MPRRVQAIVFPRISEQMFHRKLIRELKLSRGRTLQGECSGIRRPIQDREISFFCQCSYNETELSWDVNQADAAEKTRADRDGLHSEVYCSGCPLSTQVLRCSTAQRYIRPLARRTRAVVFFLPHDESATTNPTFLVVV